MRYLEITLGSDLCAGNGESTGNRVDTDIWVDSYGLPLIPGRRLKGCLRESADFLADNGLFPSEVTDRLFGTKELPASLTIGDALLPDHDTMRSELRAARGTDSFSRAAASPNNVTDLYTHVAGQTKMENGVAAKNSLRFTRVLNAWNPLEPGKQLRFLAPVSLYADETALWNALNSCCKATRHIGTHRSRGLGQVSIRLIDGTAAKVRHVPLPPKPEETEITLEYHLALDANIVLQNGTDELNMIPGRTVIGAMAGEWLKDHSPDTVFDDLFLNGCVRWSDLTPVIHGRRSEPAPLYLVWSRNLNAYVNLFRVRGREIGKTKPVGSLFASESNGNLFLAGTPTDQVYHHRHAHGKTEAQLYQHESLEAGMVFAGQVTFPERLWPEVTALLQIPDIRIGHSRSAQYAACHPVEIRIVPSSPEKITVPAGEPVYALLTSDMVLSRDGLYTARAEDVRLAIAESLGLDPEKGRDDRCHYHTLGGYQATWRLRKPQITAVAGGSMYAFLSEGKPLPKEITLGEYSQEGLGHVRILSASELHTEAQKTQADRVSGKDLTSATGLLTALYVNSAGDALRKSADRISAAFSPKWASQEYRGLLNRLRTESQVCQSPEEFLHHIEAITDRDRRTEAAELFRALYGSGTNSDVIRCMLSEDGELLGHIESSREARKALLAQWRKPLMYLLHSLYFSKAGDPE